MPAWGHRAALLHLLCTAIVLFSNECTGRIKYLVLIVKCLLFAAALRVHRLARFGPREALVSLAIAAGYVASVDIASVYTCAPSSIEYASATGLALGAYALCGFARAKR